VNNSDKPVVGLVGGIGSGKSRVAQALAERGGRVVSGDEAGHEALRQPDVIARVAGRWGPGVLDAGGQVDRRRVAAVVFADPAERKALEGMVFPWIEQRLARQIAEARRDGRVRFVVLDAAVLLEAGWDKVCDRLVYVHAPREVRLGRVAARRGWSEKEVQARERAQWPLAAKAARADVAVDNSGSLADVISQADALLKGWGLV
jgi:dephospho-CoA kinase